MIYAFHRIITIIVVIMVGSVSYIARKRNFECQGLRKTAALLLFCFAFIVSLLHKEAISSVIGLNYGPSPFGDMLPQTILATLLVWFTYSAILLTAFSQFANTTIMHRMVKFFALPVFILDIVFFDTFAIANIGTDPSQTDRLFLVFITMIIALGASLALSQSICEKHHPTEYTEVLAAIGAIVPAILISMPPFVPQVLLGFYRFSNISFSNFTQAHRIVLYLAIIFPLIAFHILKDRDMRTKRICMIFFSAAALWSHLSYYQVTDWTTLSNLPLSITSMAIILMPVALVFNRTSVFNCCLFLGVLTAFTNMLFPGISGVSVAATENAHFWFGRFFVFTAPVLCLSLKIFKRPKASDLPRAMSAFAVYFAVTLLFNTFIKNYGISSDYLNFANNYLISAFPEFAAAIKEISFDIHLGKLSFAFHPIYELLIFISYEILIVLMWLAYKLLFKAWDKAENRRLRERDYNKMKKDLKELLGNKSPEAPMYGDDSPKLVLRQFSKKYGTNKHYSVDHVSFSVKGGEIFGFLGPNGAGKSTIIKSIVGIQTITSGSIEICGYDVERQSIQAKLNTGFVPDHYALYENLTGREYINYIADLYNVDKATRDETIEKYVLRFQLSHSFDNPMKTYSHGMKQKIAIMAALVHNPKVWILDEPLTGLDPNSIHEVKECMKEHAAKGNIVFFSSHIIDVVEKICDKIAIIKKGRIRAAASVAELDRRELDLEELYLHVITSDDDEDIINIGGDDIINVAPTEKSSEAGVPAV